MRYSVRVIDLNMERNHIMRHFRNKNIVLVTAFIVLNAPAYAGCVGPEVNGQCLSGTSIPSYDSGSNSSYQSNSGASYQYDLNKPTDKNRYSTDLDAQRRDQMNTDSRTDIDRNSGQRGGGIYNGFGDNGRR